MRRQTVYPGQIPLETDLLSTNKNVMVAIGHLLQDMIGTSTLFSGLGCVPTSPAGMTVNVNPGRAYSYQATDAGAYSSLAADAHQIVKQGILLDAVNFACPAPTTAGFSIAYLIEGAFQEIDAGSVVLPYYNASNPAQAYSGPNGTGTSNTTYRDNTVQLQLKAGIAATTGSQAIPTPDAGFSGLWVVTVPYGATAITAAMISPYNGAPFLVQALLPQIQSAPNSVVGQVRNLAMSVAAASATATLTADEIMVETALGGQTYKLASFSKTINLATTGAGGMDTGTAPTSGFVALYAIFNPTTSASALLATNATSAIAPNIYGGANMPSGYTASALVSVWPTNASSQFVVGAQQDRDVGIAGAVALTTSVTNANTTVSVASIVPKNARTVSGSLNINFAATSGQSTFSINVYDGVPTIGAQSVTFTSSITSGNSGTSGQYGRVKMIAAPTIAYSTTISGSASGSPSYIINISGYSF